MLVAARVPKLAEHDIQPDQSAGADDATRTATYVENSLGSGGQPGDDSIATALPVALQGHDAVVGARVIVRRGDRVAQPPHCPKRFQVRDGEACQPGMRLPGQPSAVVERHLLYGKSRRDRPDQNLFEDVEIGATELE